MQDTENTHALMHISCHKIYYVNEKGHALVACPLTIFSLMFILKIIIIKKMNY